MAIDILFGFVLTLLSCVDGSSNSCQDIDHDACVAMATQNSAICSYPTLASAACPSYCNNCPVTCYNCNVSASDVSPCNTMTCTNNMICLMKEVHSVRNGHHMYYLGCATKAKCEGERKRALNSRDVNIHCCNKDLCNSPSKKLTSTLSSTQGKTSQSTRLPTSTVTITTPLITTPPIPECTRDIIFVVDQSISFEAAEYPSLRVGLAKLVSRMNIRDGAKGTKVSLYTFDIGIFTQFRFDSGYNVINAIRTMSPYQHSYRYINKTSWFQAAYILSKDPRVYSIGNRPSVPDVVVLITGRDSSGHPLGELRVMSAELHARFNNVIAIGIGQDVQPYLSYLTTDSRHLISISHSSELQSDDIILKILELMCA